MNLSDERPLGSSPAAPETVNEPAPGAAPGAEAAPGLGAEPETVATRGAAAEEPASEKLAHLIQSTLETLPSAVQASEAAFVATKSEEPLVIPELGAALGASGPTAQEQPGAAAPVAAEEAPALAYRPSFFFLGVVSSLTLFADIATKGWAEVALNRRGFEPIEVIDGYLSIILAYNRGGAWGLLQNASEYLRKPFFLGVSVMAIIFIVSLYSKLHRSQRALTWGLPLVLGGALGNLSDRITRSQVVDFIDYRSDWVLSANLFVQKYVKTWSITDHWPTFNVADIAICIGVILMAVDMLTTRRPAAGEPRPVLDSSSVPAPTPSSLG